MVISNKKPILTIFSASVVAFIAIFIFVSFVPAYEAVSQKPLVTKVHNDCRIDNLRVLNYDFKGNGVVILMTIKKDNEFLNHLVVADNSGNIVDKNSVIENGRVLSFTNEFKDSELVNLSVFKVENYNVLFSSLESDNNNFDLSIYVNGLYYTYVYLKFV